ncbi:MAG: porin family protein [Rikenellaceae bacterium]
MKKIFYTVVAMCAMAVATNASAQEFKYGVKAGLNLSTVGVHGVDIDGKDEAKSMTIGYAVGVTGEYKFNDAISLSADLLLSKQGVKYIFDEQEDEHYKKKENFYYVNLPIMFNYYFAKSIGLGIYVGVQPSYLVGANRKEEWSGLYSDSSKSECMDEFYKFDVAVPMGFVYDYSENWKFDARFTVGVLNTFKGPNNYDRDFTTANKCVTLSASYMF